MDVVENNISRLLEGLPLEENPELCDFTLADQNEATVARGVTPSTASDYVPIAKNTVTYIVMAVLFNSNDEVLMMQEAKKSCAGQWYLPAGRVEPGEDLEEAVKREVLEETGLHMEPTTLVMVECASKAWFRFIITGHVTGGRLKMPADADAESLQAKWVADVKELSLRANDVMPIIERGLQYHLKKEQQHPCVLPAIRPHKRLLLRLVICIRSKSSNRVHVLLSEKIEVHLPLCEINHMRNLHSTLRKFMVEIFGADVPTHKPHGVLSVEHNGKPEATNDGICITTIVAFRVPLEEVFPIDKYTWLQVNAELGDRILARLPRWMTVPLNVIR